MPTTYTSPDNLQLHADGDIIFAADVNDNTNKLQALLSARVILQAATPGTQQTGHINISGTLLAGAATLSGALTAASAAITGAATIGTTLGVTGATTLGNLAQTGTLTHTDPAGQTRLSVSSGSVLAINDTSGANVFTSEGTSARWNNTTIGLTTPRQARFTTVYVAGGAVADISLIIRAVASQTANLQEWQNSAGATGASVSPAGNLVSASWNGVGATSGTISIGVWQATPIADAYVVDALTINGGTIDNTPIGATTRSTLRATTGDFSSTLSVSGATTLAALSATTGTFSGAVTAPNYNGLVVASGTVTTGVWQGTAILDAYVDNDLTITSTKKITATLTSEQARFLYDTSNYLAVSVLSAGNAQLNLKGSSSSLTLLGIFAATSIQNTPIGSTTASSGAFTTVSSSAASTLDSLVVTTSASVGTTLGVTGTSTLATLNAAATTVTTFHATGTSAQDSNATFGGNLTPQVVLGGTVGSQTNQFLAGYFAELKVGTLVAADVLATTGGDILVGPTTSLVAAVTANATTIDVKHNNLRTNDTLWLKANGLFEAMLVTSGPSTITGGYRYTVTRNQDGTGANAWNAGDAVFNTGQTGSGFWEIYSDYATVGRPLDALWNYNANAVGTPYTGGLFSANYNGSSNWTLFADNANTEVGDAIWFGTANTTWSGLNFNIGTVMSASVTLVWEYAQGLPAPTGLSTTVLAGGTLAASTIYYYVVTSVNANGETTISAQISGLTGTTNKTIKVDWGSVSGATAYKVYRSTTNGGPYLLLASPGTNTYTDTGAVTPAGATPTINTAYNGTWTTFTPTVSPAGLFTSTGYQSVTWTASALTNWAQMTFNSVAAFFVRVRISAFTSFATQPTQVGRRLNSATIQLGPAMTAFKRNSTAWSDLTPVLNVGQLMNLLDYTSDTMGFAVGNNLTFSPAGGLFKGLAMDPTNGVRLYNTPISLFNGTTQTVSIQASGYSRWGRDISSPATTTLSLFTVNATAYNGETFDAGDLLIGDNSANQANIVWDDSEGTLAIRRASDPTLIFRATAQSNGSIATINGVLDIAASGGRWHGSGGSFGAPTTGWKAYGSSGDGVQEWWNGSAKTLSLSTIGIGLYNGSKALRFYDATTAGATIYSDIGASDSTVASLLLTANRNDATELTVKSVGDVRLRAFGNATIKDSVLAVRADATDSWVAISGTGNTLRGLAIGVADVGTKPTSGYLLDVNSNARVVGALNATSQLQINGTSINVGGTLPNVVYKDQANVWSNATQTISATRAVWSALHSGTTPANFAQFVANAAYMTTNAGWDGTQWSNNNTALAGGILSLTSSQLQFSLLPSGATSHTTTAYLTVTSTSLLLAGGMYLDLAAAGIAGPTAGISAGTKIVLYNLGGSATPYGIGINSNEWYATLSSSADRFTWYAGTTEIARLSGAGKLSLNTTATASVFLQVGTIPVDRGTYAYGGVVALKSLTNNGGSSPAAPEIVQTWAREGVASQAYANFAEWKIARWENNGVNARTEIRLALTHGAGETAPTEQFLFRSDGSLGINNMTSFGSGAGVLAVKNAGTNPSTTPTSGFVLYADTGAAKIKGGSGTVTTIAAAEPHCPRCGSDFAVEWVNPAYGGRLALCMRCLTGALDRAGIASDQFAIALPDGLRE